MTPSTTAPYPKRLIEVDLPIRRISAHARREKSIRHGHISTLHIWWARRPLAACRAVICAALWPDPADALCPPAFRDIARERMRAWADLATRTPNLAGAESFRRFSDIVKAPARLDDDAELRAVLLDFIADFANWDNSTNPHYLETARALTQAAHEALGGEPGTRPLVMDPFAGGGAIPLEALRVGADAFASDLNPVAVLLNKVVLEYIPKYGQRLADEVRKWGQWIKEQAEAELAEFYPKDPDGATPIAYLWARTIRCEGPGCGAEVPLIRSLWLVHKPRKSQALRIVPNRTESRVDFDLIKEVGRSSVGSGTTKKGAVSCPVCGFTTPVDSVRRQLRVRKGGTADARLVAVVLSRPGDDERQYRLPNRSDVDATRRAAEALVREERGESHLPLTPLEFLPPRGTLGFRIQLYGMERWRDLFTPRQLLVLSTMSKHIRAAHTTIAAETGEDIADAVQTCLALTLDKQADYLSGLCTWHYHNREKVNHTFARQALPFVSDFVETTFFGTGSGNWMGLLDWTVLAISANSNTSHQGTAVQASASDDPLPDGISRAIITDPPYYDAVPYSDLSDFFYVWLKRTLPSALTSTLFASELTPKGEECIVDPIKGKDSDFFERQMMASMLDARRILSRDGIGVVVFAHKSTAGWEAQLQAMVDAGWSISGSWPIDTEMGTRLRAHDSAALASSIHLVCRPRDQLPANAVGDWRDVLDELPRRIHAWLPRLVKEGIVGADAIFACLGPAVEIFSRYQHVEKANGDAVTLREYLPHVWAAVSREALRSIFEQADATGFEEDARLTALWLWTLFGGQSTQSAEAADADAGDDAEAEDEDETPAVKVSPGGAYVLEFDAARKIAQGLGAHLDRLPTVVAVKGDKARLLPVAERARHLFGKEAAQPVVPTPRTRRTAVQSALPGFPAQPKQGSLDDYMEQVVADVQADTSVPIAGATVLDRLHQAMLLFAGGRTAALRRFLVEEGIGRDERFWRLAQALSALYPMGSDEKRWVDGVLARKKGWGL